MDIENTQQQPTAVASRKPTNEETSVTLYHVQLLVAQIATRDKADNAFLAGDNFCIQKLKIYNIFLKSTVQSQESLYQH